MTIKLSSGVQYDTNKLTKEEINILIDSKAKELSNFIHGEQTFEFPLETYLDIINEMENDIELLKSSLVTK